MKNIPFLTKFLMITCFDKDNKQFGNLFKFCDFIAEKNRFYHYNWENKELNLKNYWFLNSIFIFGHGAENEPLITDKIAKNITPGAITLPKKSNLYLLVCHQDKPELKKQWAISKGNTIKGIYSCDNTTETVMTTLFMLHLVSCAFKNTDYWFSVWLHVNNFYRKDFSVIINTYIANNLNYKATKEVLKKLLDYKAFDFFFEVSELYEKYLDGIIG